MTWAFALVLAMGLGVAVPEAPRRVFRPGLLVSIDSSFDASLERRLVAELLAMGFSVSTRRGTEFEKLSLNRLLEDLAPEAAAVVQLRLANGRMEISVLERLTLQRTVQELPQAFEGSNERIQGVLAVRAVELIRARLVEIRENAPEPVESVEPPVLPPFPKFLKMTAELGPAMLYGPGGVPPSFHGWASFRYRLTARLSVGTDLIFPIIAPEVKEAEGEATLRFFFAGAALRYHFLHPDSRLQISAAAGAAFGFAHWEANPVAPFSGRVKRSASAVLYLIGRTSYALNETFSLGLNVLLGTSVPGTAIDFVDRRVARFGRFLLSVAPSLAISF